MRAWPIAIAFVAACRFAPHGGGLDGTGVGSDGGGSGSSACTTYPTRFGSNAYRTTASTGSWDMMQADCASDGGHLVKILAVGENGVVKTLVGNGFAWIGLRDTSATGPAKFTWTDSSPLGMYDAFNGPVPMNTMGKPCVDIGATAGEWSNYFCDYVEAGVCECP
jgi:hypothetical protein